MCNRTTCTVTFQVQAAAKSNKHEWFRAFVIKCILSAVICEMLWLCAYVFPSSEVCSVSIQLIWFLLISCSSWVFCLFSVWMTWVSLKIYHLLCTFANFTVFFHFFFRYAPCDGLICPLFSYILLVLSSLVNVTLYVNFLHIFANSSIQLGLWWNLCGYFVIGYAYLNY